MRKFWETVGVLVGGIMSLVSLPLMILNMFGGIVSGIWLMIIGHWSQFGLGIFVLLAGSFLLGLVIMPTVPLELGGLALMKKGKTILAGTLLLLASAWIYFVIYMWCGIVFSIMIAGANGHMLPSALWGYANAVGPWAYMASKGGNRETGSMLGVFAAQLGCVSMMVGVLFRSAAPSALGMASYLFPFILVGFLAHAALLMALAVEAIKQRRPVFE